MEYIKAPFNFVPVSSEVYYPGWADQISHDIPFSDGISGKLSITIEAKTPIFIRDSKSKTEFCHIMTSNREKEYFIPGTSIKGMVRNVLEILSFSKFDKIYDSKYAIRDLHNSQVYTLKEDSNKIRCGWLSIKKNDQTGKETVKIVNCGIPWRISHQQLDDKFSTNFVNTFNQGGTAFEDGGNGTRFKKEYFKTAKYKYDLFNNRTQSCFKRGSLILNRQLCLFSDDASDKKGTIVFTGQPTARIINRSGKFYEFVFIEPETTAAENPLSVDKQIWSNFKFHYYDYDDNKASVDWKWRKSQLEKNEKIPVFFRLDDNDSTKVKDLGLSYLYKMPYKHSVKDLLPEKHKQHGNTFKPDLAESIFGFTDSDGSLKGRVSIGPAFVQKGTHVTTADQITTVFGSPKASYYPLYIKQSGDNGRVNFTYKTFMDDDAILSGFKRYPVKSIATSRNNVERIPEKMRVNLTPLCCNTKFETTIRYFNLRPVELGALLSALTFHNNSTYCYHALGMGKPDGFGRVSIQIQGMDSYEMEKYLNEFESELSAYLSENKTDFKWNESPQVKELIAMAKLQENLEARQKYMDLFEFAKAKGDKLYLENYSKIASDTTIIRSYSTSEDIRKKKDIMDKQKETELELRKEDQFKKLAKQNRDEKNFQIGQHFNAVVCDNRSVDIPFPSYTVNAQLVLSREEKFNPPESGSEITVEVKQLKRTGDIVQVAWKK